LAYWNGFSRRATPLKVVFDDQHARPRLFPVYSTAERKAVAESHAGHVEDGNYA
jgi:hypothetical protein